MYGSLKCGHLIRVAEPSKRWDNFFADNVGQRVCLPFTSAHIEPIRSKLVATPVQFSFDFLDLK
jgi:hypothetical protein